MSDQGWQNAVLQDLGVPRTGLVTAAQAGQPTPPAQPRDLPPESVPVLAPQPRPPEDRPTDRPADRPTDTPTDRPTDRPPAESSAQAPTVPWDEPIPLAAPTAIENGRQPEPYPAAPAAPERPPAPQHYDLAHPDLAFPDLAHPGLELSPAESQDQPQQPADPSTGPHTGPHTGPQTGPQTGQHTGQQTGPQTDPWNGPHTGQQPGSWSGPQPVQQPVQQPGQPPAQPPVQQPDQRSASWSPGAYGEELVRNKRHGDPLMRRMGRGLRSAVGASAAHDARENADLMGRIRLPVPTCRRIAVTSIRGGAGKTTVAGLMATVITQIRQDRVLAADADSGLGSLPLRMGVQTDLSLQDLARAWPRSWDEAARFLARSTDGLWVLSNTSRGRIGAELEIDAFRSATGEMSRYFSAIVIDCGAGLLPELQRGILAEAHAQVLVTPATVDGALSARGALDWMAGNGFGALLPRTVVTLVTHTPHEDADLDRAQHMLSAGGIPVVHVPYDRHLAGGTPIDLPMTGEAARLAATRIAAEVFSRAASA